MFTIWMVTEDGELFGISKVVFLENTITFCIPNDEIVKNNTIIKI